MSCWAIFLREKGGVNGADLLCHELLLDLPREIHQPHPMAAKKKTKSKTPKTKNSKPKASAGKSSKAKVSKASKAKKPIKEAKKKASSAKSLKKSGVSKKKASAKAAPKAPAKKAKAAKPLKKAADSKKKIAPKVSAKGKKPVEKVREKKIIEKPVVKDIEKVLAVEAPKEAPPQEEVVLTDSEGRRYCRVKDCDQLAAVDTYCRYHYLLFWKKIQIRKKILTEGKLEKYIEELTARYPDKYLDMLRKDLRSEKEFLAAIQELEIDDSNDENMDEEDSRSFIEEVRGISEGSGSRDDDY